MPFVLPADPNDGDVAPASWGDAVRAGLNYLANPPSCRVYNSADQATVNGGFHTVAFNSERWDTDSMHDTVTNNSRITINTAGVYVLHAHINWAASAAGERIVEFYVNGATEIGLIRVNANSTGADTALTIAATYKFATTNYVQVRTYQTSGGSLNINSGGQFSCEFGATWIGLG